MSYESTVALEHLDGLLKTILRVKLREFVHLSPCFRDIPSINTESYPKAEAREFGSVADYPEDCPNRSHAVRPRRRYVRHALV